MEANLEREVQLKFRIIVNIIKREKSINLAAKGNPNHVCFLSLSKSFLNVTKKIS